MSVRLKVFKGDTLVTTRDFAPGLIKLGRQGTAHLCLEDDQVSRIHAVLQVEADGRLSLTDMGSARGTFLNGKRLSQGPVQPGDEIQVGGLRILVEQVALAQPQPALPQPALLQQAASEALEAEAVESQEAAEAAEEESAAEAQEEEQEEVTGESAEVLQEGRHRAFRLLEKPFGSYVPRQPQARRPQEQGGRLGLQIRYYWGDTLLQVSQHPEPTTVLVGSTGRCDLKVDRELLPSAEYQLVRQSGEGFELNVAEGMRGELDRAGDRRRLGPGGHELHPTDFAWVEFHGLRAELSFTAQPRRVVVPLAERLDYQFLQLFVVLGLLVGAFVVTTQTHVEADVLANDLSSGKLQMVRVILKEAQQPRKHLLIEKLEASRAEKPAQAKPREVAEKAKGPESKAGKEKVAENRANRAALKSLKFNPRELVQGAGLLGSVGGGALSAVFNPGGDLKAAMGKLTGPRVGDTRGLGGLSLKGGPGTGDDGRGPTGIGAVVTKGRAGGHDDYGVPGPLDRKESVGPEIKDLGGNLGVSLDRELIRKVIKDNLQKFRYCYEKELQTKPGLAGKLAMRFNITPTGAVSTAVVAEGSTLTDPAVAECVSTRVRSFTFPAPKGGGNVLVTYPFVFKQSGE